MAQGTYKVNEEIEVSYQAAGATTGLSDVQMNVYDETRTLDGAKSGTMTEIGSTGRYYVTFTPDAVGKWRVMIDSATKPGKIIKDYDVVAHNISSIGDAVDGLNDLSTADVNAEVDTALADYDAPTKAELDSGLAALNDVSTVEVNAEVDSALADYDAPTKAEMDSGFAGLNDISTSQVATELETYDAAKKAELDTTESNIRGGTETLESLKTAINALPQAAPPMIG